MKETILFLFALALLCGCDFSGESKHEEMLFQKIQAGMSFTEVTTILGKADTVIKGSDSTYSSFYFTKSKSGMRSQMPVVTFDSVNKVIAATYGRDE